MTRRHVGARGPRRFRVRWEYQVPAKNYAWVRASKAFSSAGARDEEANFLARLPEIRNVESFDAPTKAEARA